MTVCARILSTLALNALAVIAFLACATPASAQLAAPTAAIATATHPWLSVGELRQRYGDTQSHYMTIRGLEVHYKDEGPRVAPVLLMIHGSVSTLRTWDRITALLKTRYRVIRYDIPGYGLSGSISDGAASSVHPTDIAEGLLDQLHVKHATVIGVSSGGTMGMYLAAKRPDLVERLILSNTPSDPVKTDKLVQPESFLRAQAKAKTSGFQDQDFWNEYLTFFAGDPARIRAQTRKEYYDFNRRIPERHPIALVARIGDGKQALIDMAKVHAPTFLIWGGADPLLPNAAADALARYLPGVQLSRVTMPDVGHYPPLEAPDRFARLITDYVEAVTPQPAPR